MSSPESVRDAPDSETDWATPAERSGYRTTPTFAETVAYLERLARAYPDRIRLESFGRSGEGRPLLAVVASRDGVFDPATVHASGRAVLLVQNCIHSGEPDGKDACLALLRDVVRKEERAKLLERVVLVVVPIYNVDGHERRSGFHRINQNGPEPAGWRANATNLNLNRDYLKADAPETRAFLRLFHRWMPDFFVDDHVTDGADFEYDVTFAIDATPDVFPATAEWVRSVVTPGIERHVNASGHLAFPAAVFLRDDADPAQGLAFNENPPRFSTGYVTLENRPALLVEMHMLKDYRTRVGGNYEVLRGLLEILDREAPALKARNRDADEAASRLGTRPGRAADFPLVVASTGETTEVPFRGVGYDRYPSAASGSTAVRYSREPRATRLPMETRARVAVTVRPPSGYIVPRPWTRVVDVLEAHGVAMRRTTTEWTGRVERYRCSGMRWPSRPFEGRFPILRGGNVEREFGAFGSCVLSVETMTFPEGPVVVPLDQRLSKVAIHWLEPEAPDSALRWGFFDAIFEQKEGAEPYVLEPLAAKALASDPAQKTEFESRLKDPAFAGNPGARLDFFYERSPWFAAQRIGEYPVGRLLSLEDVPTEGPAAGRPA